MTELPFASWDEVVQTGTYEQSFDALIDVVRRLEAGELSLDDSVRCYEIGTRLARRCETLLRSAELRITLLTGIDDELVDAAAGSWLDDPDE